MLSAVWRVSVPSGTSSELFEVLLGSLPDTPCAVFYEGHERRKGMLHQNSGFNYVISNDDELDVILEDIKFFVEDIRRFFEKLPANLGLTSEIDLGFSAGDFAYYTRTVRFSPLIMGKLAEFGTTLAVTRLSDI